MSTPAKVTRRALLKMAAATGLLYSTWGCGKVTGGSTSGQPVEADFLIVNGRIATQDERRSFVAALAIRGDRILATGSTDDMLRYRGTSTIVIDVGGRTVIPGLIDSHMHIIRGGLHYNMELRWDGVPSLADALRILKVQAQRTPAPQWVRVVGGWSEFQFAERRMPTLGELNEAAPDTPVFVLHLYDRALLNQAAVRAVGYTKDTPDPIGGVIERDKSGNPTGLLIAKPNALILYATLAKGPKLAYVDQINSSRQFMRELNRLGVTSVVDAGGGYQNYPDDYAVVSELARRNELTVRIAYNLFTQRPKQERDDFAKWVRMTKPGEGDAYYRMNGAGEMLVYAAADFEDFLEPRPDLVSSMEQDLTAVVTVLAQNRWPFRLHATYNESITRSLNVFEAVNREVPFGGLHWFFDHAETITPQNIERVKRLGGGIAIQHRMAFQGEYFLDRYGAQATAQSPPIKRMLEMGVPVGAGTDATRVASHNPFVSLYWMVAGKTIGGTTLYPESNRLSRMEALRLSSVGSSWFSSEDGNKGALTPGQLADLAVLSADYFSIPEEEIKRLESVFTMVGGKVVYGTGEFERLAPAPLPVSPNWSPTAFSGGYGRQSTHIAPGRVVKSSAHVHLERNHQASLWPLGCNCFAF
jgi:predicted amidohydrolase YtcJ